MDLPVWTVWVHLGDDSQTLSAIEYQLLLLFDEIQYNDIVVLSIRFYHLSNSDNFQFLLCHLRPSLSQRLFISHSQSNISDPLPHLFATGEIPSNLHQSHIDPPFNLLRLYILFCHHSDEPLP